MLNNIKGLKDVLKDLINVEIQKYKGFDLFVITGVNEDLTFNIKKLNLNKQYDNVEMISQGLGNGCGFIFIPPINTVVLVGFLGDSETPIILGTLFDVFSNIKDAKLPIKQGEIILVNKTNGAYIFINENNEIKIKEPNGEYLQLDSNGLKTSNYNSSDGSQGITQNLTVRNSAGTGTSTITVKNGIITGFS